MQLDQIDVEDQPYLILSFIRSVLEDDLIKQEIDTFHVMEQGSIESLEKTQIPKEGDKTHPKNSEKPEKLEKSEKEIKSAVTKEKVEAEMTEVRQEKGHTNAHNGKEENRTHLVYQADVLHKSDLTGFKAAGILFWRFTNGTPELLLGLEAQERGKLTILGGKIETGNRKLKTRNREHGPGKKDEGKEQE